MQIQVGAVIGPFFSRYKRAGIVSVQTAMEFLKLAGLDVHRDVPLAEIRERRDKIVQAYLLMKAESEKKLPKRFVEYGENIVKDVGNTRALMAFLRQVARQANAAILCKKTGCAKEGRFTTLSTYRLLVQVK